jgi:hypothetical protein
MIKKLFIEKIYGRQAVVYHRTKTEDIVKGILKQGFKLNNNSIYRSGIYTCYELKSQLNSEMVKNYGSIIIKFAINVSNFLILDYDEAKVVYGSKYLLTDQLKNKGLEVNSELSFLSDDLKDNPFTSTGAYYFYGTYKQHLNKFKGIIFTSPNDGKVLVSFDPNILIPLSFCETDTTGRNIIKPWEKILNKETLKRYSLR